MEDALEDFRRTIEEASARLLSMTEDESNTRRADHNLQEIGCAATTPEEPSTLEHLMLDYVGHLKHHLRQIFDE
ncbi:MAG: hypothetical protein QOE46_3026 [Acidobacteriota bacterium]|jgi:hypothetical protein|nr:hypothetical protein [Acidobacteriota bacterium]